uniref:Uncharacterized protein n=1 Tax=viral metagenome TaxID=1070528 RepID=A0A6C0JAC0_9ZZZZ
MFSFCESFLSTGTGLISHMPNLKRIVIIEPNHGLMEKCKLRLGNSKISNYYQCPYEKVTTLHDTPLSCSILFEGP